MRFVIHNHSGGSSLTDHLDFMIEVENGLATWQVAVEDLTRLRSGESVPAQKIADHRKEYLSYEGPLSGDRGKVTIVDTGDCVITDFTSAEKSYALTGKILKGQLSVRPVSGDLFTFRFNKDS